MRTGERLSGNGGDFGVLGDGARGDGDGVLRFGEGVMLLGDTRWGDLGEGASSGSTASKSAPGDIGNIISGSGRKGLPGDISICTSATLVSILSLGLFGGDLLGDPGEGCATAAPSGA